MVLNQIAVKFLVEDLKSANISSAMLSKILNNLEIGEKPVSNIALTFLKSRKLLALFSYAKKETSFSEYLIAAELEQKNRRLTAERDALEERLKQAKLKEDRELSTAARQREAAERKRAYDNDPKNIAKAKQFRLRNKYDLSCFIEKSDFQKLMKILRCVDNGNRLSEGDIAWLYLDGEEYFTNLLKNRFHSNEANFYTSEFKKKKDPWLAVNASSHYRKCGKSQVADLILDAIKVSGLKNVKLKSAIYTTHGGVKRDLNNSKDALMLGDKAHELTKKDFRPCTLLGAVNMETGSYNLGQAWYAKAIENGFSEKSMDYELRSIFKRANKSDKNSLRRHLLKIDPKRYSWVNQIIGIKKPQHES